ncbi:MAG: gliding motility-associated C-terminal domain-containing protein [Bacteroidia bacterium]|nr:gliding motility-associated C-terminal domain-containing protein [Bacteroidia bacterium]
MSPSSLRGQGQNNNWYFGYNNSIRFSPSFTVGTGQMLTDEGSASVSDAAGNLLFYTDGITIWNSNQQPMPGGNGVLLGNSSSTQSAVIVPLPGSSTIYYVITADQGGYGGTNQGIHYTVVDMTLNNGLGDVVTLNTLLLAPPATEKITACRHQNCVDYWIVTHSYGDNQFQAFQLTASGFLPPVTSNVGMPHLNSTGTFAETIGYMKISPNRTRLALAVYGDASFAELFDFDAATGIISNPVMFNYPQAVSFSEGAYGVSFSPNSNLLYISFLSSSAVSDELYQYNLISGNPATIIASQQVIASSVNSPNILFGALQIGPDNRMYMVNYTNNMDVIEFPDVPGAGCSFQPGAIVLPGIGGLGLPNMIEEGEGNLVPVNLGNDTLFCGTQGTLTLAVNNVPGNIYSWSTGSTDTSIIVSAPGIYSITVINAICADTAVDSIIVSQLLNNQYPDEIFICEDSALISPLLPNIPGNSYTWNTGQTTPEIQVNISGTYVVSVSNGSCVINDTIQVDFGIIGSAGTLNVFTPNGDGINDVFAFPTAAADGFDLEIFSRWGNSLFRSSSPAQGWDGSFNSSAAEEGVYYWRLRTTDCFGNPEMKAGFVTLMR